MSLIMLLGSSTAAPAYPLDDDGTAAAYFSAGHLPTSAPSYNTAAYSFVGPESSIDYYALPTLANILSSQAIPVGAGKKLAGEMVINSATGDFGEISIVGIRSSGGSPVIPPAFVQLRVDSGIKLGGSGALTGFTPAEIASATAFRIGVIFDGDTGDVTVISTAGLIHVFTAAFTPGESITWALHVEDDTDNAGAACNFTLVPSAADMLLPYYPAGCTDFDDVALPDMPTFAVWNAADKAANIALSGSDLIVTGTGGGWGSVRATIGTLDGDVFFTLPCAGVANIFIGVSIATGALPDYPGLSGHLSWGLSNGGYVASPGALNSSGIGAASLLACRIKRSTSEVMFYADGVLTHTFSTAAADGQVLKPMETVYDTAGGTQANLGKQVFGMTVPAGTTAGVYDA